MPSPSTFADNKPNGLAQPFREHQQVREIGQQESLEVRKREMEWAAPADPHLDHLHPIQWKTSENSSSSTNLLNPLGLLGIN